MEHKHAWQPVPGSRFRGSDGNLYRFYFCSCGDAKSGRADPSERGVKMGFAEEEMAQLHGQSGGSDTYYTAAVRESSVVTATLGDGTVLRRLTRAE